MSHLQPPLQPPMVPTGQLVTPPTMSLTDATFQVARSCLNAAAEPNIRQLQQPVLSQACAASGGSGFLQLPEKLQLQQLQQQLLQQLLHWRQNWLQQQQLLLQQQPVGSRLSQQPVRPSTSTESTRKRKGTDSVPRRPAPPSTLTPIQSRVWSSIPAPAHTSMPLSCPRPSAVDLSCWPNATPQSCAGRTMTARMLIQPIAALFTLVHGENICVA